MDGTPSYDTPNETMEGHNGHTKVGVEETSIG
jgi:hypothetical protein